MNVNKQSPTTFNLLSISTVPPVTTFTNLRFQLTAMRFTAQSPNRPPLSLLFLSADDAFVAAGQHKIPSTN